MRTRGGRGVQKAGKSAYVLNGSPLTIIGDLVTTKWTYTMQRTESLSLMEWMHRFHWLTAECTYTDPDCEPSHIVGSTEDIFST